MRKFLPTSMKRGFYDIYKLHQSPKKFRWIFAPKPYVKVLQSTCYSTLIPLTRFFEKSICGSIPGKNIRDAVKDCYGKKVIFKTDLKKFFESVTRTTLVKAIKFLILDIVTGGDESIMDIDLESIDLEAKMAELAAGDKVKTARCIMLKDMFIRAVNAVACFGLIDESDTKTSFGVDVSDQSQTYNVDLDNFQEKIFASEKSTIIRLNQLVEMFCPGRLPQLTHPMSWLARSSASRSAINHGLSVAGVVLSPVLGFFGYCNVTRNVASLKPGITSLKGENVNNTMEKSLRIALKRLSYLFDNHADFGDFTDEYQQDDIDREYLRWLGGASTSFRLTTTASSSAVNNTEKMNRLNKVKEFCKRKLDYFIEFVTDLMTTHRDRLPEGAVTSPILSNIVLHYVFKKLKPTLSKYGLTGLSYLDDITFYTNKAISQSSIDAFLAEFQSVLMQSKLQLNKKKTRVYMTQRFRRALGVNLTEYKGTRSGVTIRLPRRIYREIRSMVHNYVIFLKEYRGFLETHDAIAPTDEYISQHFPKCYDRLSHFKIFKKQRKIKGHLAWASQISPEYHKDQIEKFKKGCEEHIPEISKLIKSKSLGLVTLQEMDQEVRKEEKEETETDGSTD